MKERRLSPRFSCQLKLGINFNTDQTHNFDSCDISEIGLGLHVSHAVKQDLAEQGITLDVGNRFELFISPGRVSTDISELKINCQVKHIRRLSQEKYFLGVWFEALHPVEQIAINDLVETARLTPVKP